MRRKIRAIGYDLLSPLKIVASEKIEDTRMKRHCLSAVRKVFAVILCTAVAFAYFPLSGLSDGKSYAAVSWISQVKSAKFIPDDPSNYQFYDGADNVPLEPDEELEDDYYFWGGDRIVATLNDGTARTITYYEDEDSDFGWWEDEDEVELSASEQPRILQTPRLVSLTTPQKFDITIEFAGLTIRQQAELLASPVKSIAFTPVGTEEDSAERFTITQGEEFFFDFVESDKLTVNINGETKDYFAMIIQDDSEPDTYYVDFRDSDNNELPYEYGSVDVETFDSAEWAVGTNYIYIKYGKARAAVPVNVTSNTYSSIKYKPVRTSYTEAELILMESYDEEEGKYYCDLDLLKGDQLTLVLSESGEEKTYTYDGAEFRDNNGELLDDGWGEPDLYYEGPAQTGSLVFTAEYAFLKDFVTIEVSLSSDAEAAAARALRDAREAAADKIESMLSDLDLSLYREAQQEQLFNEFNKAYEAVWEAATPEAADNIAKAFESFVKGVKTDAQMTEEESRQASEGSGAAGGQTVAPSGPAEIIDLPAVKISKPKAAKKKLTVKWKKPKKKKLKKIKGIQIQVATDPGFTNIVKTAKAGKKKTSKVIKGLKPKTKYYVRIRAYGAPNHYSVWKTKSGKTK